MDIALAKLKIKIRNQGINLRGIFSDNQERNEGRGENTFFHSPKSINEEGENEEEEDNEEVEGGDICSRSIRRIPIQGKEGGLAP